MSSPSGITVDEDGFSYVIEQGKNRVIKFDPNGDEVLSWGKSGDLEGEFDFRNGSQSGIGIDSDGYIYVSDMANNRIQKFTKTGDFVKTWGTDVLSWPLGLSVSPDGHIYVVDGENHQVRIFTSDGELLKTIGEPGDKEGQLGTYWLFDSGVAVFDNGNFVINSPLAGKAQIFSKDGGITLSFGEKAYAQPESIYLPTGIIWDNDRNQLVVSNNNHHGILYIGEDGQFIGKDEIDNSSYLNGIDIDEGGNLYIFDTNRRYVYKISPQGEIIKQWGGRESPGDSEDAIDGKFNARCWGPIDLAVFDERLYVADSCDARVQVFDLEGKFLNKWGSGLFDYVIGIDVDHDGDVYVVNRGKVSKFTPDGELILEIGTNILEDPYSVVVGEDKKVFVGQREGTFFVFSEQGDLLFSWEDKQASLIDPWLAVEPDNDVYVVLRTGLVKYRLDLP
jgi:DNA-binding beta-propeller fold protein YncE